MLFSDIAGVKKVGLNQNAVLSRVLYTWLYNYLLLCWYTQLKFEGQRHTNMQNIGDIWVNYPNTYIGMYT